MKKILIMMFLSLMSINVFGYEYQGVYYDDFRHWNQNKFDINNVEHFAKEYTQFKEKEDPDPTKYYLDSGDSYIDLIPIPENVAKAERIEKIIDIVDCNLEELDELIDIEARKTLYLDPHIDTSCIDEYGNNCINSLNDYTLITRIRPLRQEIYKRITSPFEVAVLDWIITQRMEKAIWNKLDIKELSKIQDTKKRIQRFKEDSEKIWQTIISDFYNPKTGNLNDQTAEYMKRIRRASIAYLHKAATNLNEPNIIIINNTESTDDEEPKKCGTTCELSGGFCDGDICKCYNDTNNDGINDVYGVDLNGDDDDEYCNYFKKDPENDYAAGNNCANTVNSRGEVCNGHGTCFFDVCGCDVEDGYWWYKGNCVGFYLNLLDNDPISLYAFENATGQYNENEGEGRFYATEIWHGWKEHDKDERYMVAKNAKTFFDKIRIGDVLNVRGIDDPLKFIIAPIRGFYHHTTMAAKDLDVVDGYVIDPFDKAFISARGDGVMYEPRRMYQYLYYKGSDFSGDGYFYTPHYYIITAQTPEETMFGWTYSWKKISLFWGWIRISIPIPFFYTERPSEYQRKKAVIFADSQEGKPYNLPSEEEIYAMIAFPLTMIYNIFNQYRTDKYYCTSLVWRSWDMVENSWTIWGFDIDSTLNPTVFPMNTVTDWNMGKERALIYTDLLSKAFYLCDDDDTMYCNSLEAVTEGYIDSNDITYGDAWVH